MGHVLWEFDGQRDGVRLAVQAHAELILLVVAAVVLPTLIEFPQLRSTDDAVARKSRYKLVVSVDGEAKIMSRQRSVHSIVAAAHIIFILGRTKMTWQCRQQ